MSKTPDTPYQGGKTSHKGKSFNGKGQPFFRGRFDDRDNSILLDSRHSRSLGTSNIPTHQSNDGFKHGNGPIPAYFNKSRSFGGNGYFQRTVHENIESRGSVTSNGPPKSIPLTPATSNSSSNLSSRNSIDMKTRPYPRYQLTQESTSQNHYFTNGDYRDFMIVDGKPKQIADVSQSDKESFQLLGEVNPDVKDKKQKIRWGGNGIKPEDPRIGVDLKKYIYKAKATRKLNFKKLKIPQYRYDKHSLGPEPTSEVVISGVKMGMPESLLKNRLSKFGNILIFEDQLDRTNGTSLGIFKVKFDGSSIDAAHSAAKAAVRELDVEVYNGTKIKVALNTEGGVLEELIKEEHQRRRLIQAENQRKADLERKRREELEQQRIQQEQHQHRLNEQKLQKQQQQQRQATKLQSTHHQSIPDRHEHVPSQHPISNHAKKEKQNAFNKSLLSESVLNSCVKGRPHVIIPRKFLPQQVSAEYFERDFKHVPWRRVKLDPAGLVIIFESNKQARDFFNNYDGTRHKGFNLILSLQIDTSQDEPDDRQDSMLHVSEITYTLVKELEEVVTRDIIKSLAPVILGELNIEKYPDLSPNVKSEPKSIFRAPVINPAIEVPIAPSVPVVLNSEVVKNLNAIKRKNAEKIALSPKNVKKRKLQLQRLVVDDDYNSEATMTSPSENDGKASIKSMLDSSSSDEEEEDKMDVDIDFDEPVNDVVHEDRMRVDLEPNAEHHETPEVKETKSRTKLKKAKIQKDDDHKSEVQDSLSEKDVKESEPESVLPEEPNEETDDEENEATVHPDYTLYDERYRPTATDIPTVVGPSPPIFAVLNIPNLQDLIDDEEDFALLKEIMTEMKSEPIKESIPYIAWKQNQQHSSLYSYEGHESTLLPSSLENDTGSHRSQGYVKIPDHLKSEYLAHKKRIHDPLKTIQDETEDVESAKVQSSRVNRANNRRFANEVANFNTENEALSINQLNKRRKPVTFARSAIHNWGLYALEPIAAKEMIIEYVGERIRQQIAEVREKEYLKSGIGSSYLFRVDENTVIDATKTGGIARFINHCCVPSCTAKIIKVEGQKRIVIYALRDIGTNEELTYDYKFERETNNDERVRCLCGAPGCKGYLN